MCIRDSITGETINRCTHIHHSQEDLLKKQLMTRLICHRVGGCMQRCMGTDAMNALFSVTYDCDEACGTEYHQRLLKYIEYCQKMCIRDRSRRAGTVPSPRPAHTVP